LLAITACTIWTQDDGIRLWAEHTDTTIARKRNIEDYLNPRSAVVSTSVQEVKSGKMEYTFEEKLAKLYRSAEEKCRFIVVVEKDTGKMIGWRYNGNPEYCTDNP
jgi:hypothetical protein